MKSLIEEQKEFYESLVTGFVGLTGDSASFNDEEIMNRVLEYLRQYEEQFGRETTERERMNIYHVARSRASDIRARLFTGINQAPNGFRIGPHGRPVLTNIAELNQQANSRAAHYLAIITALDQHKEEAYITRTESALEEAVEAVPV